MIKEGILTQILEKEEGRGERARIKNQKRRMLSIQDVPNLLVTEGIEILAIPNKLDMEIKQVLQQRNKDGHDQSDNVDNVQILERMVCVGVKIK